MKTRFILTTSLALAFGLAIPHLSPAANQTWSGLGDDGNFNTGANWGGGAAPGNTLSGATHTNDAAAFHSATQAARPVVIDAGRTVRTINFGGNGDILLSPGSFTFNGSTLFMTVAKDVMSSAGGFIANGGSGSPAAVQTFNVPIIFVPQAGAEYSSVDFYNNRANHSIIFNETLSVGALDGAFYMNLGGNNAPPYSTINGSISDGGATGGVQVIKNHNSKWALAGHNTHSAGTVLNTGTLALNHGHALGSGAFTINGGILSNTSGGDISITTANALVWNAATITYDSADALHLGNGSVDLGATGAATERTLRVNDGELGVGGVISNGTNGTTTAIEKTGAGALTLGGANTFSGGITHGGGTLNINHASALGTGELEITGSDVAIGNTSGGAVTVTTGNAILLGQNLTFEGSGPLDLGTGTVRLGGSAAGANRTVTVNSSTLTFGGAVVDGSHAANPTRNLIKAGDGTLRLEGSVEYTGATTINAGTLLVNGTHLASADYTVNSGGALGGDGTIGTTAFGLQITLNAGARLAPGDQGPGELTLSLGFGSISLADAVAASDSRSLLFTLAGTEESSRLTLSSPISSLIIGEGLLEFDDFDFRYQSGFEDGRYVLFEGTILGSLGELTSGFIGSKEGTLSIEGNQLLLTTIPEPSAIGLLLAAGIGGWFCRRRKA